MRLRSAHEWRGSIASARSTRVTASSSLSCCWRPRPRRCASPVIRAALDRLGSGLLSLLEPPRRPQEVDVAAQRPRIARIDRQRTLNPGDRFVYPVLFAGDPGRGGVHARVIGRRSIPRQRPAQPPRTAAPTAGNPTAASAHESPIDRQRTLNPGDRLV